MFLIKMKQLYLQDNDIVIDNRVSRTVQKGQVADVTGG